MTTAQMPDSIQAIIHQDAINRVSGFFNATIEDILNELLQNARRSGATRVEIQKESQHIRITDNGRGIKDPRAILSFGQSEWEEPGALNEHPAGMGLYALARNESVTIRSRTQDSPTPWQITLTPDHFVGKISAPVEQVQEENAPTGTTVTFQDKTSVPYVANVVGNAARYFPVPVFLNSHQMEQEDFLKEAVHVHEYEGLRIGVYRNRYHVKGMNFHGIVVDKPSLPEVHGIDKTWITQVDILDCPHLELTLPARKEAVQTPFLDDLRRECRRAAYTAITLQSEPTDLTKDMQEEAVQMGINIPQARAMLPLWAPGNSDFTVTEANPRQDLEKNSIILDPDMDFPDQQALGRAIQKSGMTKRFLQANNRLQGYPWYDGLPTVEALRITVATSNQEINLVEHRTTQQQMENQRPDRITFTLEVVDKDDNETEIHIPGDLVFEKEEADYGEEPIPLVTKDSELTPTELQGIMMDSFFRYDFDGAADSYETQKEESRREFEAAAVSLLSSQEDAIRVILENALAGAKHQIPQGTTATIRVTGGKVLEITFEETQERREEP